MVVDCLECIYDRLHGSNADYTQNLTREAVRNLITPIIQAALSAELPDEPFVAEDLSLADTDDDQAMASSLIRMLSDDGWLETFADRAGLVIAFRFTRAGKLLAEALWAVDKPQSRARQRNMRSCRNALSATLVNVDAYDLIDAYDYAAKVISDLSDSVTYFQDMVRRLMVEASTNPWEDFLAFLDHFDKRLKIQFSADSVMLHRTAIRETLHSLRHMEQAKFDVIEQKLHDVAEFAVAEKGAGTALDWMLDRIEDSIDSACATKQPELIRVMNSYMGRAASIVHQAMVLKGSARRHAYSATISHVATLTEEKQTAFLERLGQHIAVTNVKLLDPASFKLRGTSQRRKALTVTAVPVSTYEGRLNAALERAEAGAFSLSESEVKDAIVANLRLLNGSFRLSSLPMNTAIEVLHSMQAVESVRNAQTTNVKATKLDTKLITPFYQGNDYLIEFTK